MDKHFNLRIAQWNSQSLRPKRLPFEILLNRERIHIALVSETWLEPDSNISFNGYNIFRKDRLDAYGGVAIIVHRSIKAQVCHTSFSNAGIENILVKIFNCKLLRILYQFTVHHLFIQQRMIGMTYFPHFLSHLW